MHVSSLLTSSFFLSPYLAPSSFPVLPSIFLTFSFIFSFLLLLETFPFVLLVYLYFLFRSTFSLSHLFSSLSLVWARSFLSLFGSLLFPALGYIQVHTVAWGQGRVLKNPGTHILPKSFLHRRNVYDELFFLGLTVRELSFSRLAVLLIINDAITVNVPVSNVEGQCKFNETYLSTYTTLTTYYWRIVKIIVCRFTSIEFCAKFAINLVFKKIFMLYIFQV